MSEYCKNCASLQAQYDKVVEQNRELQKENRELRAGIKDIFNRTVEIVLKRLHIEPDEGGINVSN